MTVGHDGIETFRKLEFLSMSRRYARRVTVSRPVAGTIKLVLKNPPESLYLRASTSVKAAAGRPPWALYVLYAHVMWRNFCVSANNCIFLFFRGFSIESIPSSEKVEMHARKKHGFIARVWCIVHRTPIRSFDDGRIWMADVNYATVENLALEMAHSDFRRDE